MSGILSLDALLREMKPQLSENEYVFCSVQSVNAEMINRLKPICTFHFQFADFKIAFANSGTNDL